MTNNADLDDKIVELDRAREQSTAWLAKCIMENGRALPVLANALIGLRDGEALTARHGYVTAPPSRRDRPARNRRGAEALCARKRFTLSKRKYFNARRRTRTHARPRARARARAVSGDFRLTIPKSRLEGRRGKRRGAGPRHSPKARGRHRLPRAFIAENNRYNGVYG
jgi:hypothetical protein